MYQSPRPKRSALGSLGGSSRMVLDTGHTVVGSAATVGAGATAARGNADGPELLVVTHTKPLSRPRTTIRTRVTATVAPRFLLGVTWLGFTLTGLNARWRQSDSTFFTPAERASQAVRSLRNRSGPSTEKHKGRRSSVALRYARGLDCETLHRLLLRHGNVQNHRLQDDVARGRRIDQRQNILCDLVPLLGRTRLAIGIERIANLFAGGQVGQRNDA